MEQEVYSLTVPALGSATATVPVVGWISVVNGGGDACMNGHAYSLEFRYGSGHAVGRGSPDGFGTGCGGDEVCDVASGRGDVSGCYEEIEF